MRRIGWGGLAAAAAWMVLSVLVLAAMWLAAATDRVLRGRW